MKPHDPPAAGWFAHPVLSLMVAAAWLLLRESAGPADLLWAAIFGLGIPRLLHRFLGTPSRPRAACQSCRGEISPKCRCGLSRDVDSRSGRLRSSL